MRAGVMIVSDRGAGGAAMIERGAMERTAMIERGVMERGGGGYDGARRHHPAPPGRRA